MRPRPILEQFAINTVGEMVVVLSEICYTSEPSPTVPEHGLSLVIRAHDQDSNAQSSDLSILIPFPATILPYLA